MESDRILINSQAVEPFMKNGYLLACKATRKAAYIDPGDEAAGLIEWLRESSYELESILLTHGHLDHISGVRLAKERWDVPILIHRNDELLYSMLEQQAGWFGLDYRKAPQLGGYLEPGRELRVGELVLDVLHTPGHSPGSVCLLTGQYVFCGDLIFAGSVGRTDLPGGSHEALIESIRSGILPLGDNKVLLPGHGPVTTIGQEKRTNPYLFGLGR